MSACVSTHLCFLTPSRGGGGGVEMIYPRIPKPLAERSRRRKKKGPTHPPAPSSRPLCRPDNGFVTPPSLGGWAARAVLLATDNGTPDPSDMERGCEAGDDGNPPIRSMRGGRGLAPDSDSIETDQAPPCDLGSRYPDTPCGSARVRSGEDHALHGPPGPWNWKVVEGCLRWGFTGLKVCSFPCPGLRGLSLTSARLLGSSLRRTDPKKEHGRNGQRERWTMAAARG